MSKRVLAMPEDGAHEGLPSAEVAALFKRFQPALVRFFEKRSFSPADAEDLTQEVFIKITRLDASADLWQPEGFLFQIAANVLRDKLRRDAVRHRKDQIPFDETIDGYEGPSEESVYEGRESLMLLLEALKQLTPKCRSVFLMHKYEGLTYSEIARHFSISVSAVEKHMMCAAKHLKQIWHGRL